MSDAAAQPVPTERLRLMRKRRAPVAPVTPASLCLFRLGEACNNDCPMCSNSGREAAFFIKTPELLRRVDHLAALGFRRVVLTGGEATIHPGFWDVVARLGQRGMGWDLNTHGRTFADAALAWRARREGLARAIVSLHHHEPGPSAAIFGTREKAHHETVEGIANLKATGARMTVNLVLTTLNVGALDAFADFLVDRFGPGLELKLAFPSTLGKGGGWEGIQLRYRDVREPLRRLRAADRPGLTLAFESVPNCVIGDSDARDMGRSGFGETHYLEDIDGREVFPIRYIEAELSAYPETCRRCAALSRCPGVAEDYLRRYGASELVPFAEDDDDEQARP